MISEREKLEFESLPEFIREPYLSGREAYSRAASAKGSNRDDRFVMNIYDKFDPSDAKYPPAQERFPELESSPINEWEHPKSDALDTLWPGVDRDEIFQPSRRSPSFYLTVGFLTGAVLSLVGVFSYSFISHSIMAGITDGGKKIVVAGAHTGAQKAGAADQSAHRMVVGGVEVIQPAFPTYEVKNGDTLAGIALKAYKRVSPRMLDEICKANGMRSANVLSLGQKVTLPNYTTQAGKVATGAAQPQM